MIFLPRSIFGRELRTIHVSITQSQLRRRKIRAFSRRNHRSKIDVVVRTTTLFHISAKSSSYWNRTAPCAEFTADYVWVCVCVWVCDFVWEFLCEIAVALWVTFCVALSTLSCIYSPPISSRFAVCGCLQSVSSVNRFSHVA